jgi:hypothetical protein
MATPMGLEPSVDRYKVTKTRELIDCGFYDDPEILNVLFEHCVEAILYDMSRSRARETRAHVIAKLPTGYANRARVRPMRRKRWATVAR